MDVIMSGPRLGHEPSVVERIISKQRKLVKTERVNNEGIRNS